MPKSPSCTSSLEAWRKRHLACGVHGEVLQHPIESIADPLNSLAGLPKNVLQNAQLRADHLKYETGQRLLAALARRSRLLIRDSQLDDNETPPDEVLKNVLALHKALELARKV